MQIHESGSARFYQKIQRAQIESDFQARKESQSLDKSGIEEKLNISGSGMEKGRLLGTLRNEALLLPDLREEKLAQVQEKISSGFYQTPEFQDVLAERLSESPMVRIVARENNVTGSLDAIGQRPELMAEVDDKLQSGFYSDGEVMDFVAERLAELYGIS